MLSRRLIVLAHVLAVLAALAWGFVTWRATVGLRSLSPLEPLDAPARPSVAVVVASRDEADSLLRTVDDLLAQEAVERLRVVAVDDRSGDDTPGRLSARAALDPRLVPLRVTELPPGWLGKPHACARGAAVAGDAEWLLFVDADVRLGPDVVARAVRTAERTGAAHLCLIPALRDQTGPGRATCLALALGLAQQAAGVESDRAGAYFGVGSFTLIRREAYAAIGGHEALRMEVLEDVMLARRARGAGYRTRLRFAVEGFSVRWVTTLGSVFGVLEKNYFALFGYSVVRCGLALAAGSAAWLTAVLGPWVAWPVGLLPTLAMLGLALPAVGLARRYRWPAGLALLAPLLLPVAFAALARSAFVTLRQGGVRWRETFYPLAELRAARR